MKKIFLILLFIFSLNICFSQMYPLTWTSANTWNIKPGNSEATNTSNVYTAIRWLITQGGGTLYLPNLDSIYLMRIVIPAVTSDSICTIRILGATPVERRFGTVNAANLMPSRQVVIKSAATSGAGVISVSATSYVTVRLENLDIRTYDQPQIHGIDLLNANRCDILNCIVETGVFNTQALFPVTLTYGIRMPTTNNGASCVLKNVTVTGYYVGIDAFEHTSGNDIDIASCGEAIRIEAGVHAIQFGRLGLYGNNVNFYGIGANNIYVEEANIEHFSAFNTGVNTAWMITVNDVKDSANLVTGTIQWASITSNTSTRHLLTVSGATNLSLNEMGKTWSSTQNTSNIYYNLGLVSVGTTTSTDANGNVTLTVQGPDAKTAISATNGTVAEGMYLQTAGTAQGIFGTTTNHNLGFFTNNGNSQIILTTGGFTSIANNIASTVFRTTNAGSDVNARLSVNPGGSLSTAGTLAYSFETSNGLVFTAANGTRQIARASEKLINLTNTAASEKADLSWLTQRSAGAAISESMRLTAGGNLMIGTTSDNGSVLQVNGSMSAAYVAKTGTYTATASDYTIECTSGTFTVTLPTAAGITGRIYNISNSGAGTITIATTSSQTFVNVSGTPTTLTLSTLGNYQVQSNGANWLVL